MFLADRCKYRVFGRVQIGVKLDIEELYAPTSSVGTLTRRPMCGEAHLYPDRAKTSIGIHPGVGD